jgi:DNA-directed RNA polymerase subunit RPC12/RpoP
MKLISTSWRCHRCGGTFISDPPWNGLCNQCLADLQTLALEALPETVTCPSCGGPVCPACGAAMLLLVPVAAPADAPATGQVTGLIAGYRARRPQEVTGDD